MYGYHDKNVSLQKRNRRLTQGLAALSALGLFSATTVLPVALAEKLPTAATVIQQKQINEIQSWKAAPATELGSTLQSEFPALNWWQSFNDPTLSALIEKGLEQNPALKAMQWQIASATASAKSVRANLMPKASFTPSYTWEQLSSRQFFFPIQGRNFQIYQIPITASYELDLFGKNRTMYQSAKKGIRIAQFQAQSARIQLAAAIATTYFNIAKWRQLETLAQEELQSSQKLLSHSEGLLDLGQATTFDIQNSQQRRDLAQVNVTQYGNNRELAENELLSLLGEIPTKNNIPTVTALDVLNYPTTLDTGLPSQLITHRPDVAITELQLDAAKLDISVARRAMLPTITLNGSTGPYSFGAKQLFKWTSISSLAAGTLSQPIFQGGRLRAEVNLRKANYRQLLSRYEDTLNNAFTEAENSLATLHANQVVYRDVQRQTANARVKAKHQEALYQSGLVGEPLWLAEDVQRIEYEKQLVQQKTQILIDAVSVAKAMGGGFTD